MFKRVFRFQREEFKGVRTGVRMYGNYMERKHIYSPWFAFPCMLKQRWQQLVMRRLQKFYAPDYTRLQSWRAEDDVFNKLHAIIPSSET